ncbi:ChaN family lipoprotein [Azospirillum halopraeferens]|uniref:ChaN family lipoprotein n=1 Tax=Azospirillum halopraeferens TaxID=34010 RepID=UPI0003FD070B|nr:ChaN family lipoprotein [Azospirillum halopraeferens]
MPRRLMLLLFLAGCALPAADARSAAATPPPPPGVCVAAGAWSDGTGQPAAADALLRRAAAAPVVLLGETHDNPEHHRWQLHTLAGIHAINPGIAVGLEMFPRSSQAALDRWTAGLSTEEEFLRDSRWAEVWGFGADMYLPIFHFARMHRLPLVALNVDRALVSRTGREGWAAIPESEREGVGNPAAPPAAYLDRLAEVMAQHGDRAGDRDSPAFARFVEAQSVWDRAMAERIAETRRATGRTVVALMGSGHIENRHGVPHQLDDLGITGSLVLLPWDATRGCVGLDGRVADAVFGVAPPEQTAAEPPRPRLGVVLEPAEGGVRIGTVQGDSVAAAAGLATGDLVVTAAGTPVRAPADLVAIVRRQAPGTWLPITVRRDRTSTELVAKFPAE